MKKRSKTKNEFWWKDKADPVPMEIPADLKRPETMDDRIKRIIAQQISPMAEEMGEESIEEANDFEIPEDELMEDTPLTRYEFEEMPEEVVPVGSPVKPEAAEQQPESEGAPVAVQQQEEFIQAIKTMTPEQFIEWRKNGVHNQGDHGTPDRHDRTDGEGQRDDVGRQDNPTYIGRLKD